MAWKDSFAALTYAQQIEKLDEIANALGILRRQVVAGRDTDSAIGASTQTFASGWQAALQADVRNGGHGLVGIKDHAGTFYNVVEI